MTQHWNEIPHRFGLFGVDGEVRPQYFVYQLLAQMGDERLAANCAEPDLRILAGRQKGKVSVLLANYNLQSSCDRVVSLRFTGLQPGRKVLTTYRIDKDRRWNVAQPPPAVAVGRAVPPEMPPLERREVDTPESFHCQVFCPADTVAMLSLEAM
jgi:hypothetical protein